MAEIIIALIVGLLTIILSRFTDSFFKRHYPTKNQLKEVLSGTIRFVIPSGLIIYSYLYFDFTKTYVLFTGLNFFILLLHIIITVDDKSNDMAIRRSIFPKKLTAVIISGLLLILLIAYFWLLPPDTKTSEVLSQYFTAVSSLTGVAVLVLAIMAYRKYFLDAEVARLYFENVNKLCYRISKAFFKLEYSESGSLNLHAGAEKMVGQELGEPYSKIANLKIVVNRKAFSKFYKPIRKMAEQNQLPEQIIKSLAFLEISAYLVIDEESSKDYARLQLQDYKTKKDQLVLIHPAITVKDFAVQYLELNKAVNQWSKKYTQLKFGPDFVLQPK